MKAKVTWSNPLFLYVKRGLFRCFNVHGINLGHTVSDPLE